MDNLVWRSRAKVVAILDLIFSSFSLLITILTTIFVGGMTVAIANRDKLGKELPDLKDMPDDAAEGLYVIMWVAIGLMVLITAVQLWASIKLLNATELGRNPVESLQMAKTWRLVTVIFVILNIVSAIAMGSYIGTAIGTAFRAVLLYIVHQFILELTDLTQNRPQIGVGGIGIVKV